MKTTKTSKPTSDEVKQSWVDAYDNQLADLMDGEWTVGEGNRGHGHYSYAVIMTEKQDEKFPIFKTFLECPCIEVAQHIVDMHNKEREQADE